MDSSKLNIFDYTKGITQTKKIEYSKKVHNTYMINTIMSMHKDTVGYANMVNHFCNAMTDELIFDFLFYAVPPKKRWAKYVKPVKLEKDDVINSVAHHFKITFKQAEDYLKTYQS